MITFTFVAAMANKNVSTAGKSNKKWLARKHQPQQRDHKLWINTSVTIHIVIALREKEKCVTSLTSRKRHPKWIVKPISDPNIFRGLQSWCLTFILKMKSKDQAILDIFHVKKSSNLIGRENFDTKN